MSTQGTIAVSFALGALEAVGVVTGQSGILSTHLVEAWAACNEAVGSQNDDSAWVEQMTVMATKIVPGVGFTVVVKPALGVGVGTYNINWVWN